MQLTTPSHWCESTGSGAELLVTEFTLTQACIDVFKTWEKPHFAIAIYSLSKADNYYQGTPLEIIVQSGLMENLGLADCLFCIFDGKQTKHSQLGCLQQNMDCGSYCRVSCCSRQWRLLAQGGLDRIFSAHYKFCSAAQLGLIAPRHDYCNFTENCIMKYK